MGVNDAGLPSRRAALDIVTAVTERRQLLDEAVEACFATPVGIALEPRDRAFARALATETVRRLGQIDDVLDRFLDRPLAGKAARTRTLLRLGIAQILFLKTAPHAAVDQCVTLAGQSPKSEAFRGLINAVLRRAAREGDTVRAAQDPERLAVPDWLWHRWVDAHGEAATRAIARQHLDEPPLDLSVKAEPQAWAERLGGTLMPSGSVRLGMSDVTALPGYQDGAWWVQDMAAALPARLLPLEPGMRVLDLCAAPGGKTLQLAAAGADVTAMDRSAKRLERVRDNLDRTGLSAELVAADAGAWTPEMPFPLILLDAPCSATGTLRRHPDIAQLKSEKDVAALADLQRRLLDAALGMLAPGGTLVYCTCSLETDEGPDQIAAVLERHPHVRRVPIKASEIGGLADLVTPQGDMRSLPCHLSDQGGMDGFFAARLQAGTAM